MGHRKPGDFLIYGKKGFVTTVVSLEKGRDRDKEEQKSEEKGRKGVGMKFWQGRRSMSLNYPRTGCLNVGLVFI